MPLSKSIGEWARRFSSFENRTIIKDLIDRFDLRVKFLCSEIEEPVAPVDPDQTIDSENPEGSDQTIENEEPNRPIEPEFTEDPENSEDPQNPGDPDNSEDPQNPGDPDDPDDPSFTEDPETNLYYSTHLE